jgi:hypothetical protein
VSQSPSRAAWSIRFGGGSSPDISSTINAPSGQVSESIFVPNNSPEVTIIGGNRTVADTDNVAGELAVFSGTATDSGGIASTQWLINGAVIATGTSATLALNDGTTVVSFRATDNNGSSATKSVTYTVIAPTFHLPRISGVSNLRGPSNSEFTIAFRDLNNFPITISPVTQSLAINGYIFPQDSDENFTADLFVVAVTPSAWYMRTLGGAFVRWNGRIADLLPAFENRQLTAQVSVPIFTGRLPGMGTYRFYVGYMRVDSSELIYTANAATLTIIP